MYPDMEDWLRRMGTGYKWGGISKMKKYLLNNISVRNKLLVLFTIGILVIPVGLFLIKINNYSILFILGTSFCFFYCISNFFLYVNNSDININEINNTITIRKLFTEKQILLNNIEIYDYIPSKRLAFIFNTNIKKIILNYTQENYDEMIKILKLIKNKNINSFIENIEKRSSIINLNGGQWFG